MKRPAIVLAAIAAALLVACLGEPTPTPTATPTYARLTPEVTATIEQWRGTYVVPPHMLTPRAAPATTKVGEVPPYHFWGGRPAVTVNFRCPGNNLVFTWDFQANDERMSQWEVFLLDSDGQFEALIGNDVGSTSGAIRVRYLEPGAQYRLLVSEADGGWTIDVTQ